MNTYRNFYQDEFKSIIGALAEKMTSDIIQWAQNTEHIDIAGDIAIRLCPFPEDGN